MRFRRRTIQIISGRWGIAPWRNSSCGRCLACMFSPALFWLLIRKIDQGPWAFAVLIAGMLVTGGLITLAGVWLGNAGQAKDKRRLVQRFEREQCRSDVRETFWLGAPRPFLVFSDRSITGTAAFWFGRDRLQFVGEKTRFSLTTAEIDGIVLGSGGPNWWRFERIYVRWKETAGVRNGVFNLYLLEPGSMWTARARLRELCQRLQTWHRQSEQYPAVKAELRSCRVQTSERSRAPLRRPAS